MRRLGIIASSPTHEISVLDNLENQKTIVGDKGERDIDAEKVPRGVSVKPAEIPVFNQNVLVSDASGAKL